MGDALCGPSNPLQNFQKHAAVDRTLHQDRLISRQPPGQGFRSPNLAQGTLDSEFAAFENNIAPPPLSDIQNKRHLQSPNPHIPLQNYGNNADWAADFQRLSVSGPSHILPQHHMPAGPSATGISQHNWQNEFMKQQQQSRLLYSSTQPYTSTSGFQTSLALDRTLQTTTMNDFTQGPAMDNLNSNEVFDESAFDAAFEQARVDLESQSHILQEEESRHALDEIPQPEIQAEEHSERIQIGSDTIPSVDKNDVSTNLNDHDELAKTAGQLLDSVSHDQSQKFRESNFLALMRRIRDREVHVEGEEFREVSTYP
ncbi:hypothetical protein ASPZODRAFT_134964 [Penicilliopsis zonata CBS 506.65]|uniref:Peroxin 20 n=1 Tax=Penicilliopsis zonata CBS 506.65 TaxID=1073090 RepID=A0A1L9SCG4_9EURO|nr:hypothetical protein ASPZODRAFT_134964 [Penicilliopsis zonata CBS 506.65]OJJ44819.1 hypothetical protein ASPZODRAFT_134964 [Penicilliopsis zonata CBS 506.65]